MNIDSDIVAFQDEFLTRNRLKRRWIIVQDGPFEYSVHEHSVDGVAPPSTYKTRRLAAARLLQLLGIGPVAPQDHPEEVCIGTVTLVSDAPQKGLAE